jgi:hypothetical protein
MSKKYFYFYLVLGFVFVVIGTISLIQDATVLNSLYDFVPAAILLYAAFKIYKMKNDSEVM